MARSGSVEIPAHGDARVILEWTHDFTFDRWHARVVEKNGMWHREMNVPTDWAAEDIAARVCGQEVPGGRCTHDDVAAAYRAFLTARAAYYPRADVSVHFWLGPDAEREAEPAREGMADAPTAANSDKSKP